MSVEQLIIITGVSGSGKSTALNACEDVGFFCVENLPVALIPSFVNFLLEKPLEKKNKKAKEPRDEKPRTKYALLIDCREEYAYELIFEAIAKLRESGTKVLMFYLDAQDEIIMRRFRETRRPHPLALDNKTVSLVDAIERERKILSPYREISDKIIDTSSFSPHQLKKEVEETLGDSHTLEVTLQSFGFKYGLPHDADLVVDVRFLPNPYFDVNLSAQSGLDKEVKSYVLENEMAERFLNEYSSLLNFLIPHYQKEGKHYLTIAVGCTGGQHRSVAIAEELSQKIGCKNLHISTKHRDLKR